MKCDFCQENYIDKLLSKVIIDEGEKVMLCDKCEGSLKKTNE
jgi:predicted SprT family Zn-dependent metalloprotease